MVAWRHVNTSVYITYVSRQGWSGWVMRSFSLSPWIRGVQQEEKKRRREKGESMSYTALQLLLRNHQLSIKAWMTFTEVRTRKLKGNGSDLTKMLLGWARVTTYNGWCGLRACFEEESNHGQNTTNVPGMLEEMTRAGTWQLNDHTFANFWTKNCCWIVCSLSLWFGSRRGSFHFYRSSPEPPAELSESTVADVKSFFPLWKIIQNMTEQLGFSASAFLVYCSLIKGEQTGSCYFFQMMKS